MYRHRGCALLAAFSLARICDRHNTRDNAVLPTLLNTLHLPSIGRNWRQITETADSEGWLAAKATLVEIEVADRAARRIQRHRAESGMLAGKTFACFDFDVAPGVRKAQLLNLAEDVGWIDAGANLLVFGQSGMGKATPSPPSAAPSSMRGSAYC